MRKKKIGIIFIYIILLAIVLTIIYPFLHMIAVSISSDQYVLRGQVSIIPKGVNFKMYNYVFSDGRILKSYINTILYTLMGTSMSLMITAMGAYALAKQRIVGYKYFNIMILLTMFFGGGMIPTYLTVKNLQLIDTVWVVVMVGLISTWNFIIMRSFFNAFPSELEESGYIDGLNDIGIFFRLVLPCSKAVLATIGLYYAVSIWNGYFTPFIYLNNQDLFPLQIILKDILMTGSGNNEVVGVGDVIVVEESLKYATVIVSIVPIMTVYPFIQKYFNTGVMVGAVKG